MMVTGPAPPAAPAALKRSLTLPLLTLYGLGVTIGAGIYVLIGATAARAGLYAPVSFLAAALAVAFTGLSYAELGSRYPVSAGEAAYVRHGLNSNRLSLLVGLLVITSGVVSSAAISIGAAAYVQSFINAPAQVLAAAIILILGLITIWGITQSVLIAALFTVLEIGGLLAVVAAGIWTRPEILSEWARLVPPLELPAWSGIGAASLLAFFAFVGFEDIANVAEEVKEPQKTLPRAILATLILSSLLYMAVVSVVVLSVPLERLSETAAPLALMFEDASGTTAMVFNVIASLATINGVLVQMIMASRVLYGLGKQGDLPVFLAAVNPVTRTPLNASVIIIAVILLLALLFPVAALAEMTSRIVLGVFVLINLALIGLKWRGVPAEGPIFHAPMAVPFLGLGACGLLLASDWL